MSVYRDALFLASLTLVHRSDIIIAIAVTIIDLSSASCKELRCSLY